MPCPRTRPVVPAPARRLGGLLAAALLLACAAAAPRVALESVAFAPELSVDLATMTPVGTGLYVRDLQAGTGAIANTGDRVSVVYTGWLPSGTRFETNAGPSDAPVTFELGKSEVIRGWERGIRGMRVGGRRLLVIAPELAYGSRGTARIPPNAVLVFDVQVVRVR